MATCYKKYIAYAPAVSFSTQVAVTRRTVLWKL